MLLGAMHLVFSFTQDDVQLLLCSDSCELKGACVVYPTTTTDGLKRRILVDLSEGGREGHL